MVGRVEIGAGIKRTAEMSLRAADAEETSASGGRFRLFASETVLEPVTSVEGRVAVQLTRMIQVGVAGSYATARLATRLSSDTENIPNVTAQERLSQWTVAGEMTAELPAWKIGAGATPFLVAGAGYLRELHEGRTLSEQGRFYDVGGGLNVALRTAPRAAVKSVGIRVDARARLRTGGVAFDDRVRVTPAVGASFFARF
jgi:hypothetical protein